MLHSRREDYPKENTLINFDSSIAYITKNVKQNVNVFLLLNWQ